MAPYDAFISYSHAKDKPIAAALQAVIQRLGKPWHRRRALRVFRDDTSLSATPHLWPSIESALAQSRTMILLASPEAAASPWVAKEALYWLDHKGADMLLIGLTDGELGWDNSAGDFIWHDDTPLPRVLAGRFRSEPKWVDLRAYRSDARTSDARFTELAADFAATVQGVPKEDLLSQEVRQQRRALALAWSAVVALAILGGVAGWQWNVAVRSERTAIAEAARAERNFGAAKETIDSVIYDLTEGLKDVEGMRAETAQRILSRAEAAIGKLTARTDNDPAILFSQAAMYGLFSDTYRQLGSTTKAIDAARQSAGIMQRLLAENPNDIRFNARSSATFGRLGAALMARGDLKGALAAYEQSIVIGRGLVASHPGNLELQHGLSIDLNHIGEVLLAQGDLSGAVAAHRESLQVVRTLSARDPANIQWRRSMSATLTRLGDAFGAQGNPLNALEAYGEGLDISRKLAAQDPANMQWQRDVHVGLVKLGQTHLSLNDLARAFHAARESLDVARALAARDKTDMLLQRRVVISLEGLGNILTLQGDRTDALAAHRESLDIRRSLAALDTNNTEWRRDLSVGLNTIGDLLVEQGDFQAAGVAYREALDIMHKLHETHPDNHALQIDIVHTLTRLGAAGDDAPNRFREALAILNRLQSQGRLPPVATNWIAMVEGNLARALKGNAAQVRIDGPQPPPSADSSREHPSP